MGTWGENNFEADDALNVLSIWINQIIEKIRQTYTLDKDSLYGGQGEANIVANVDILGTLYKEYRLYPDLQLDELADWKRDYLETFDNIASTYTQLTSIESAKKRRVIIQMTFDRLQHILDEIIRE